MLADRLGDLCDGWAFTPQQWSTGDSTFRRQGTTGIGVVRVSWMEMWAEADTPLYKAPVRGTLMLFSFTVRSAFWSFHRVKGVDGEVALYFPCCLCLYSILEERSPLTFAFSDIVYSQVMLEKGITLPWGAARPLWGGVLPPDIPHA